jgi:iron(III) transport system permease protein
LVAGVVGEEGWQLASKSLSVVTQPRRAGLLVRSVAIAAGAAVGSLLLGVPYALLVTRSNLGWKLVFRGLVLLPLCIPTYIYALGWLHLFDSNGPVAQALSSLGTQLSWSPNLAAPWGVVLILTLRFLPLVVLLTSAGLDRVEPELEEAGRLVGRPAWVLTRITLPLARPYLVAAALLAFNLSLANYTVPSLLQVHTFPVEIFAAFSGLFDVSEAVALSLPLMALGGLSVILARLVLGRRHLAVTPAKGASRPLLQLRRTRPLAILGMVILYFVTVAIPVGSLVGLLETPQDLGEAYLLAAPQVWRTIGLAATAATVLATFGFVAGYLVARASALGSKAADFLFLLPLAFSPTVIGIGLIRTWNQPVSAWLMESTLILVVAYSAQFVPFATVPAASALTGVPRRLEEAGLLARMGWWRRVRYLLLPLTLPTLAAAWVLIFALCLDEVGASILVQPPDGEVLAVRIYNLSHYDATEMVGALCLIVLALVAVALVTYGLLTRMRRRLDSI